MQEKILANRFCVLRTCNRIPYRSRIHIDLIIVSTLCLVVCAKAYFICFIPKKVNSIIIGEVM